MKTVQKKWFGKAFLKLLLIGWIATVWADEVDIYHHDLSGREVDTKQWHSESEDRCLDPNNPLITNSKTREIRKLLDYLSREKNYAGYLISRTKEAGTLICVDNRADGTRGYYDYKYNIIGVQEELGFMEKAAIVLHELRHVDHVLRGYRLTLVYAKEEMVRLTFAIEADVQAYSALVAWRLKLSGDTDLWNALLGFERYADIAQAFEENIRASSDELSAMKASFVQWYKSPWRRRNYTRNCCMVYLDMLDETKKIEQYTKLPGSFFDQLCLLPDGRSYGCKETKEIKSVTPPRID